MNFWEARQAAKAGKRVRVVAVNAAVILPKDFMAANGWRNEHLDAKWEIVKEPLQVVTYHQVFSDGTVGAGAFPRLDTVGQDNRRISMVELITDENGKLISAKNV